MKSALFFALPVYRPDPTLASVPRSTLGVWVGRLYLLLLVLAVTAVQAAIFHCSARTSLAPAIQGGVVNDFIWMLVLAVATWCRYKNARATLAALLVLSAGAAVFILPEALAEVPGFHVRRFLAGALGIYLVSALALLLVGPLRRLTTLRAPFFYDFFIPVFSPHYRCFVR